MIVPMTEFAQGTRLVPHDPDWPRRFEETTAEEREAYARARSAFVGRVIEKAVEEGGSERGVSASLQQSVSTHG